MLCPLFDVSVFLATSYPPPFFLKLFNHQHIAALERFRLYNLTQIELIKADMLASCAEADEEA